MKKILAITSILFLSFLFITLAGCVAAAGAAGVETGYIASQDDRTVGETIDDQVLLASIKSQLIADPEVSGLSVNVDVDKGYVELRGYLHSTHEINRAVEIARHTKGVRSVTSFLVLDNR